MHAVHVGCASAPVLRVPSRSVAPPRASEAPGRRYVQDHGVVCSFLYFSDKVGRNRPQFGHPGLLEAPNAAEFGHPTRAGHGRRRRYLENLTRGRGWSARVLSQEAVEASLDRVLMVGGERRLNQLRDQAREVAQALSYQSQFKRLDTLIGALLGTQAAKHLTARQALARAAGRPYDPYRLEIFEALFTELNRSSLTEIKDPAPSGVARENFAFFEAYFSNYIEGTTFTVEEAEAIVFHGHIVENRSEDSGTEP